MELPFTTDYAKSSRAICRGCHSPIMKNCLRLAIMLQSATFDAKVPNWYHLPCFFIEHMPEVTSDIQNFYSLKAEDRKQIENIIKKGEVDYDEQTAKDMVKVEASKVTADCYLIDYARSSNNSCQVCADKIKKKSIIITDAKLKSNKLKFHVNCFAEFRSDIGFLESADKFTGFDKLAVEDQEEVLGLITNLSDKLTPSQASNYSQNSFTTSSGSPPKKQKLDNNIIDLCDDKKLGDEVIVLSDDDDTIECSQMSSQQDAMNLMYEYKVQLENLSDQQLKTLLKHNKQKIPRGRSAMLETASEMLTFGGLTKCPACRYGSLQPTNFGYQCTGMNTWGKCDFMTRETIRTPVSIPESLKILFTFLMVYDYVPRQRETSQTEERSVMVYKKNQPLKTLNFAVFGFPPDEETLICKQIKYLGGRVVSHIKRSVLAVVTIKEEFMTLKDGKLLRDAQMCQVYVVPKQFILDIANVEDKETVLEMIKKYDFSDWGSQLHMRIPDKFKRNINRPNYNREEGEEEEGKRKKVVIKRGLAIEPDAGLDDIAHVYQIDNNRYTAVLSKTDVSRNQNTYYKIQLLEADDYSKYWLFTSWGRIGTDVGSFKKTEQPNLQTAIMNFENLFRDKTGHDWSSRKYISHDKKPGKFTYIEVEYDASKEELDLDSFVAGATIHPAVAHLVAFIFNVNAMEKVLLEYSLDTSKLPLGKLSKFQVQQAYRVLNEAMEIVKCKRKNNQDIREVTNRFYSLMPHNSAMRAPPDLDSKEIINKKLEMLETLYEMETAYSMIKRNATGEDEVNPLDAYYKQLSTDIDVLDKTSFEYSIIEQYVTNTHGDTHRHYNLEILEVFKITRHEEPEKFSKYSNLHNRKLLWHGSRSTNFAGILSQGLRIAPPEAPSSGYMFGKGIYFADIVSKSANYCCVTDQTNKEGLLLLCEVALGNMHEKTKDDSRLSAQTLPKNKHSVKGVGKTQPDHSSTVLIEDGVEVPLGKPINVNVKTPLQYNEYIVYDVAQVRARYLLKMKFNFKY